MSVGIPLPELDVTKPAQNPAPNPLQEFARAAQLKTEAGQQAIQQQQVQALSQQNQMAAMQLKDEQLRRQLAPQFVQKDSDGKPTGFDNDGLYNAMLQQGADPMSIQAMRMKQAEMQKSLIGLSDAQLDHQQKVNGALYDSLESVRSAWKQADPTLGKQAPAAAPAEPANASGMPSFMLPNSAAPGPPTQAAPQAQAAPVPPQAQLAYQKELMTLAKQGIPIGGLKPVLSGYNDIDQAEAELGLHKQALADAKEQASTAEAAGKGAQGQAEAAKANLIPMAELGGVYDVAAKEFRSMNGQVMSPAMLESKYLMNQAHKNAGQPLAPEDQAFDKAYEHMKTLVPVANFNLQNAGSGGGTPGQPSAMAQAVANGTMKWGDVISPRTPMSVKNQFAAEVKAINPQFDTSTFGIEQKAAEKATSGTWADTRLAYNTAIDHADQLLTAADALKNGDVQKLNSLKNYFSTQFGSPNATTAQAIANAYNHEVTSVVAKGHMTDAEVAQGHGVLDTNKASPEQIKGVAQAYKNLMTSKRDELDKLIKAGAGGKANSVLGVQSNSDTQQSDFFSQFGGKPRQ